MSKQFIKLDHKLQFPHAEDALIDPNGLLAFGGDLSVERLLLAYQSGIFPWFSEGEPILWWSPDPRGVLELDGFICSSSLAKLARSGRYQVSLNKAFAAVIEHCAKVPRDINGTWITKPMIQAYTDLHHAGYAHSVEIWEGAELVGGLYGVSIGRVFCGESMFHLRSNTSKLAFFYLVRYLKTMEFHFIDCQLQNPHLATLGIQEIPRRRFLSKLQQAVSCPAPQHCWQAGDLSLS
ncbi:leucyl/phenylalanyl-tRNA--protein transferase [Bowmanella denitrificans]|uniref:Leucyl/phenylalanyl-tRNA--protein transferase n=1 Tax=Bowmanella denitrificans TaxID=366582 RepID=A0ABP3GNY0_9ALTE